MSNTDRSSELREAAHAYRNRGWRVIQLHSVGPDGKTCSCKRGGNCTSKGKHPVNNEWQKSEPLSAPDIEAAWTGGMYRKGNVGIATGAASGFWVLDIDPKHGGLDAMRDLVEANGPLPSTYTVQTGSGGYHYYFAMPDFDVRNDQSGRVAAGIDVRGSGGQVVAPPSVTDVGGYKAWDRPVVDAPAWLLALVRKDEPTTAAVTSDDVPDRSHLDETERARLDKYAGGAVKSMLERVRKLGQTGWDGEPWDGTTFEVACSLLEIANSPWNAYTERQAYLDLFEAAPRDSDGFDDNRVNAKWESARTKVGNKARPLPAGQASSRNEDDFFFGEDVRVDPTVAVAGQVGGGSNALEPHRPAASSLFLEKGGIDTVAAASAVMGDGPIAWGADQAFWSYTGGVWQSNPHVVRSRLTRLLGSKYRPAHASTVEDYLRFNTEEIACGPVERYVNFTNGMLDWRTGEMLDHDPAYHSTVQIHADYDADALCPTFDAWLEEVLSPDYVKIAWEMLGYLLYNGNPLQVAFLLYGSGGNGKGTLMRVMKDMLGPGAYAAESLDMLNGNNFSAINLFGKTANLAGDIDGTYQESTANFKKLTGEDVYAGERKYGDRFNFVSWAVPVFSANKIPGSADVTEGYLRRWVMIHFERTFEHRIISMSDRLMGEMPGVTAKAVAALRELMKREEFTIEGDALKGKEEFAMAIDQVRQWVKFATIPAPNHVEARDFVYDAYKLWAEKTSSGKLRATEFYHRLEAIGYPTVSDRGIPSIKGIVATTTTIQQSPSLQPDNFFN